MLNKKITINQCKKLFDGDSQYDYLIETENNLVIDHYAIVIHLDNTISCSLDFGYILKINSNFKGKKLPINIKRCVSPFYARNMANLIDLTNFPQIFSEISVANCFNLISLKGIEKATPLYHNSYLDLNGCNQLKTLKFLPKSLGKLYTSKCFVLNYSTLPEYFTGELVFNIHYLTDKQLLDLVELFLTRNITIKTNTSIDENDDPTKTELIMAFDQFFKDKNIFDLRMKLEPFEKYKSLFNTTYSIIESNDLNL